jgi:hypothetical protein
MIGFRPTRRRRTPVYTSDSVKVGYMEGEYFTDLDGYLVARIIRYHAELPAVAASCSGSHVVTPEERFEG